MARAALVLADAGGEPLLLPLLSVVGDGPDMLPEVVAFTRGTGPLQRAARAFLEALERLE